MTPEDEARRRIREAEETGALELDLSRLALNRLPQELGHLTSLQSLNLSNCRQLSDLSPLAKLTSLLAKLPSLQSLNLSLCELSGDLRPLAELPSLQSLDLSWCSQLSGNLSPLAKLTSLQSLNLALCYQLSGDLRPLAELTSLQSLDLAWCKLSGNLSPVAKLTSLQSLRLSGCRQFTGDLAPLASLTSLQSLDLSGCGQFSGEPLSPLACLASLQSLRLDGCPVRDLSPLASLTSLKTLWLDSCIYVRRFAPLQSLLPTLKNLSLYCCNLDDLPPEVCGEEYGQNVRDKVRAYYHALRQIFVSYAWGDISPNASKENRQRQEVVERLCRILQQENWKVIRDKDKLEYGDQISTFMKTLGQARLVIVVLSEKYLRSPYCMTELYSIYQNARQERQEFLNRIIPLVLKDANIGNWRGRATYAEHWETEFKAMGQHLTRLGEEDLKLYKAMRRWHNEVGDMLAYVNDTLHPHGFDEIVKDDFASLRQMLRRRQ